VDFVVDSHVHTLAKRHVSENRPKTKGEDGRLQSNQSAGLKGEDVAVTTGRKE
jgi:hypothetical protein